MSRSDRAGIVTQGVMILIALGVGLAVITAMVSELQKQTTGVDASAVFAGVNHGDQTGEQLYQRYCQICHGANGQGNGPAAIELFPPPRDFTSGKYRLVTSGDGIASVEDVARSIKYGLAGTSMPAWMSLGDENINKLAEYVLGISHETAREQFYSVKAPKYKKAGKDDEWIQNKFEQSITPRKVIEVSEQPPVTEDSLAAGKQLFIENCQVCHGPDGGGKNDPGWEPSPEGEKFTSRDFRSNIFKGGRSSRDLFLRVSCGIPGSPMPDFDNFPAEDRWHIIQYVRTFAAQGGNE